MNEPVKRALGRSGACDHVVHWWDDYDNCDRRAGHTGPHGVVGSGLYWNDKGDQVSPPVPTTQERTDEQDGHHHAGVA